MSDVLFYFAFFLSAWQDSRHIAITASVRKVTLATFCTDRSTHRTRRRTCALQTPVPYYSKHVWQNTSHSVVHSLISVKNGEVFPGPRQARVRGAAVQQPSFVTGGTRRTWVFNFTPRLFYPRERTPAKWGEGDSQKKLGRLEQKTFLPLSGLEPVTTPYTVYGTPTPSSLR